MRCARPRPITAANAAVAPAALATALAAMLAVAPAEAQSPAAVVPLAPTLSQSGLEAAVPSVDGYKRMAVLRTLDKITGRTRDVEAPAGVPIRFATLTITLRWCYTRPPEETPETTAFLEIVEQPEGDQARQMFSGWMFASSPALNALEHPIYDVWVITCKTNAPGPVVAEFASAPGTPVDAGLVPFTKPRPDGSYDTPFVLPGTEAAISPGEPLPSEDTGADEADAETALPDLR